VRGRSASKAFLTIFLALSLMPCGFCPPVCAQQSEWKPFTYRHSFTTIDDMLNKDAQAVDPAGIHYYGEDLAHLIVPDQAGTAYIDAFADRVTKAEEVARKGKRKLVPEADVVHAFNELMRQIGAPPSIRADADRLHKFRVHAVTVGALSAVLTADRNGTNCYPGEAVYLLSVLLISDGTIPEHYLEGVAALSQRAERGDGYATAVESAGPLIETVSFLVAYSTNHPPRETAKLFNHLAKNLNL